MLNHSLLSTLRGSSFGIKQAENASRRFSYPTVKFRKLKYKSAAKEKRKERIRFKMDQESGKADPSEIPLFFQLPARYKLIAKFYQEQRNANRFTRKPMPEQVKAEFVKRSKEFNMYKHHEGQLIAEETNRYNKSQFAAWEACMFLPDYLLEEAWGDRGVDMIEQLDEFKPASLYTEQLLHLFPKEFTNKLKLTPAFEESMMKYEEKANEKQAQRSVQ